jgi:hypothetical protein
MCMNWWKSIKIAGKTLYHGTSIDNIQSIQQYGLIPDVGKFTADAYQESTDAGLQLADLTFAADKQSLRASLSAMESAVERYLGRSPTADEVAKYGALAVFRDSEIGGPAKPAAWEQRPPSDDDPHDEWRGMYSDTHPQVEPGDFYRDESIKPSYVLTGKKMVSFLTQQSMWPPMTLDPTEDQHRRQQLVNKGVNMVRKNNPQMSRDEAYQNTKQRVDPLSSSDLRDQTRKLRKKKEF